MILVDTSVWIDHLRHGSAELQRLLEESAVATHPMVVGELACGNLSNRTKILQLLNQLPHVSQVADGAVLHAIESNHLWMAGIGWVDAHLLAAAIVSKMPLWTLDRRLALLAVSIGL